MAQAPAVPNFAQYNFNIGDDDEAIPKQNGQNAALVSYAQGLVTFGQAIEQEQSATLQAAEDTRQQAIQDTEAVKSAAVQETTAIRNQAETHSNEAQQAATDATTAKTASETAATEAQASAAAAEQIALGDVINDTTSSPNLLWSSQKVADELGNIGAVLDSVNGV